MITKITAAYTRLYRDSRQCTAYVEWIDEKGRTGRTEGKPPISSRSHMGKLFDRAIREGVTIKQQVW